jgi:hypothetical protein
MRRDIVAMSQRERQRFHLLQMLLDGKTTSMPVHNRPLMGSQVVTIHVLVVVDNFSIV